jgi:hypothetical protein
MLVDNLETMAECLRHYSSTAAHLTHYTIANIASHFDVNTLPNPIVSLKVDRPQPLYLPPQIP